MDSNLYKYLIKELLDRSQKEFLLLPNYFIRPPHESVTGFQSLKSFLSDHIDTSAPFSEARHCKRSTVRENYFSQLFLFAQKAMLEIVQGSDPNTHPFRSNGIQLFKFLTYCSYNDVPKHFCEDDYQSLALICFLLEGLMYCGWCPDSCKDTAKRAAHEYCILLKKSLHYFKNRTTGPVLGYLWGAWLLAQKTEGMRVAHEISLPMSQTFQWNLGNYGNTYIVENSVKPNIFYVLSKSHKRLPHPFAKFSNENLVGLSFFINNEPILSTDFSEYSEINRIKKHGHKFIFNCATKACIVFRWTIVFLIYEATFYRIDLLKVPENIKIAAINAELCLETKSFLEKAGKNIYFGKGFKNTIVEFIENPLEFFLDSQLDNGIAKFKSNKKYISGPETITVVTAWVQGKGISAINKTHLLGIYD